MLLDPGSATTLCEWTNSAAGHLSLTMTGCDAARSPEHLSGQVELTIRASGSLCWVLHPLADKVPIISSSTELTPHPQTAALGVQAISLRPAELHRW